MVNLCWVVLSRGGRKGATPCLLLLAAAAAQREKPGGQPTRDRGGPTAESLGDPKTTFSGTNMRGRSLMLGCGKFTF